MTYVTLRCPNECDVVRTGDHLKETFRCPFCESSLEPETPLVYECDCTCGALITTDEFLGSPFRNDSCDECGGYDHSEWRVSDIPHPALYESAQLDTDGRNG